MDEKKTHIRITVVGDGNTGKTCMLIVYKDKKYEEYYIPTVFDSYSMNIRVLGKIYTIILQDTAGQEEYDRLRALAYPETDVFIVCFSVDNRASYKNIVSKWNPEIRHYRPKAKLILVGTKCDLRTDCPNPISTNEGQELMNKIKADGYVECSSKFMWNVSRVFEEALLSIVGRPTPPRRQRTCSLL
ncbi:rho-related protein racC-like [Agrilus planipennis]|uniref:Rho-related protein racC-like n=1 Tax=Agrilus planipennis TaxID=224129 RepID=A0A1W4X8H9_AGRPL|nr:rho-related protein racC-like [Agrilus planipennis]